jgi:hypothetical protein
MNLTTKTLLILALLAASAAGGAYLHYRFTPTPAPSTIVVPADPVVVTKTVTKVVTRPVPFPSPVPTECPTPTETVIHETDTVTTTVRTEIRKDWSLGLGWDAKRGFERDYLPSSVELGRRTWRDAWLTGTWNWREGSLLLGLRYEF